MLNKLYFFLFIGSLGFAQVGIYGDVYIAADQVLAIHTPATHFVEDIIRTDSNVPGHVTFMPNLFCQSISYLIFLNTKIFIICST